MQAYSSNTLHFSGVNYLSDQAYMCRIWLFGFPFILWSNKWWWFTIMKHQTLRNVTTFLKTWDLAPAPWQYQNKLLLETLGCRQSGAKGAFSKREKNLEASELLMQRDSPYKPYWRRNSRIIESCQVSGRKLAMVTGHYCHIWQCLQACQVRNRVQRLRLSCCSLQLYYKQAWRGWEGLD